MATYTATRTSYDTSSITSVYATYTAGPYTWTISFTQGSTRVSISKLKKNSSDNKGFVRFTSTNSDFLMSGTASSSTSDLSANDVTANNTFYIEDYDSIDDLDNGSNSDGAITNIILDGIDHPIISGLYFSCNTVASDKNKILVTVQNRTNGSVAGLIPGSSFLVLFSYAVQGISSLTIDGVRYPVVNGDYVSSSTASIGYSGRAFEFVLGNDGTNVYAVIDNSSRFVITSVVCNEKTPGGAGNSIPKSATGTDNYVAGKKSFSFSQGDTTSTSVPSNGTTYSNGCIGPIGYYPLCVVGWDCTSRYLTATRLFIDNIKEGGKVSSDDDIFGQITCDLNWMILNPHPDNDIAATLTVYILWVKIE